MSRPYFDYIPNFEYVDRTKDGQQISDYTVVKNLFKRGNLRQDIFGDLTFFTKYKVIGDERPDNIAYEVYGDQNYDWVVMLSNNIMNLETEWPWSQQAFDKYLLDKYGSYEKIYETKDYETNEITDSTGRIIVREGLVVPQDYSVTFYDTGLGQMVTRSSTFPVSNYDYENRINDAKRNIFLLKPIYLSVIVDDIEETMPYIPGSTQYVSDKLVRGENIRLYPGT
jgi:hypothetical protein